MKYCALFLPLVFLALVSILPEISGQWSVSQGRRPFNGGGWPSPYPTWQQGGSGSSRPNWGGGSQWGRPGPGQGPSNMNSLGGGGGGNRQCVCPYNYEPLCANGKTFGNRCEFDCINKRDHRGGLRAIPGVCRFLGGGGGQGGSSGGGGRRPSPSWVRGSG